MWASDPNFSGLVINTCGWVKNEGYATLVKAAELLEPDVVVVLDHERLYTHLQRDLPQYVRICHQPKSGGVETRSAAVRQAARKARTRRYFYGTRDKPLNPFRVELGWDELSIWKVGAEPLPASCLPLGMKPEDHRTKVVPVIPSADLQHRLLGVCHVEKV